MTSRKPVGWRYEPITSVSTAHGLVATFYRKVHDVDPDPPPAAPDGDPWAAAPAGLFDEADVLAHLTAAQRRALGLEPGAGGGAA